MIIMLSGDDTIIRINNYNMTLISILKKRMYVRLYLYINISSCCFKENGKRNITKKSEFYENLWRNNNLMIKSSSLPVAMPLKFSLSIDFGRTWREGF